MTYRVQKATYLFYFLDRCGEQLFSTKKASFLPFISLPKMQNGQRPYFLSAIVALVIAFFLAINGINGISATSQYKFYYFSPDSAQSNLVSLKGEMDNFLAAGEVPLSFTPFAHLKDFDRLVHKEPPNFIFLPQWYLEQNNSNLEFIPLLEPVRNGSNSYQKILLTHIHSNITLINLQKKTLATTSFGPQSDTMLNKILFPKNDADINEVNIVITPKDSDALIALALGQVEMALVSKSNLAKITKLNPKVTQSIRQIKETTPIPLPILCYKKGSATGEDIEKIKQMFLQMNKKTNKIMEMLQIDAWQLYSG